MAERCDSNDPINDLSGKPATSGRTLDAAIEAFEADPNDETARTYMVTAIEYLEAGMIGQGTVLKAGLDLWRVGAPDLYSAGAELKAARAAKDGSAEAERRLSDAWVSLDAAIARARGDE